MLFLVKFIVLVGKFLYNIGKFLYNAKANYVYSNQYYKREVTDNLSDNFCFKITLTKERILI